MIRATGSAQVPSNSVGWGVETRDSREVPGDQWKDTVFSSPRMSISPRARQTHSPRGQISLCITAYLSRFTSKHLPKLHWLPLPPGCIWWKLPWSPASMVSINFLWALGHSCQKSEPMRSFPGTRGCVRVIDWNHQ